MAKKLFGNVEDNFNVDDWFNAIKYFDYKCAYCGQDRKLVQEHMTPLSIGGTYNKDNVVPSCRTCNNDKRSSDLKTWYKKGSFRYSDERFNKIERYIKLMRAQ